MQVFIYGGGAGLRTLGGLELLITMRIFFIGLQIEYMAKKPFFTEKLIVSGVNVKYC